MMIFNISGSGQHPEDLTDREILIQLIEKFNNLEQAVLRIEANSDITRNKIIAIDREIYKDSEKFGNLSEAYKGSVKRWNTLLALFTTFVLGIFVYMWKKTYK